MLLMRTAVVCRRGLRVRRIGVRPRRSRPGRAFAAFDECLAPEVRICATSIVGVGGCLMCTMRCNARLVSRVEQASREEFSTAFADWLGAARVRSETQ